MIPIACSHFVELLVLGEYKPTRPTGPAIWLRCVVDRATGFPGVPADGPPIAYLPDALSANMGGTSAMADITEGGGGGEGDRTVERRCFGGEMLRP